MVAGRVECSVMVLPLVSAIDEKQIIAAVLDAALSAGLRVSVWDGEEWALKATADRAAIEAAIGATGETVLRFRDPAAVSASRVVGSVSFIHGNGCDVIRDYSDSARMVRLLAPALALADGLAVAHG